MSVTLNRIGNLRENANAYLTNGRYDPRKSAVRADEYKIRRQKSTETRHIEDLFVTSVHSATANIIQKIEQKLKLVEHHGRH